jgi:hypothetical protein
LRPCSAKRHPACGTITAIDVGRITVKERDGRSVTLKSGSYTTYANVVPSSPDAIKVNDFIGSAVKGPLSSMVGVLSDEPTGAHRGVGQCQTHASQTQKCRAIS